MKLAEQKCEACEGGVEPLSRDEAGKLGEQTPEWSIGDGSIERTIKFSNFVEAIRFANRVTQIAEAENHHPDLHISYGKMRIELSTHAIGGLSINDFIVAAKIDEALRHVKEKEEASI